MRLTLEQQKLAINLAQQGKTIKEIREELNISPHHFNKMREEDPLFGQNFARARQEGLEELADNLLEIAKTEPDVQRARLHSENIRWILSKRKPETYGDKLDLSVTTTVDLGGALNEARNRALLKPAQPIDITPIPLTSDTGLEPVETKDAPILSTEDIFK